MIIKSIFLPLSFMLRVLLHPPSPKKLTFPPIFPDFSDFSLMVSFADLYFSLLLVTIIKCEKNVVKKNTKKREKSFQHSILFFENGQK